MSQTPVQGTEGGYPPLPQQENAFLKFVQRPRIMLILLGCWALAGFFTELWVNNPLFLENHGSGDIDLDGVLGGLALNWEGIPLAVLYFYCARDPNRFRGVFWLALVAQGSSIAANLYHLIRGTFTIESVVIPICVSAALALLVFLHLFRAKDEHLEALKA